MVSNEPPGHSGSRADDAEPGARAHEGAGVHDPGPPEAAGVHDPGPPEAAGVHDPGPPEDAVLHRLEERLDAASQAAERLLADAAGRVRRKPPPAGWQQRRAPGDSDAGDGLFGSDADLLLGLLASLRDRIPPELQQRLAEAVREVLVAVRALIDWYLERLDQQASRPSDVEDIPIL